MIDPRSGERIAKESPALEVVTCGPTVSVAASIWYRLVTSATVRELISTDSGSGVECGRPGTGGLLANPLACVSDEVSAGDVIGSLAVVDPSVDGAPLVAVPRDAVPCTSPRSASAVDTDAISTTAATLAAMIMLRRLRGRPPSDCSPVGGPPLPGPVGGPAC